MEESFELALNRTSSGALTCNSGDIILISLIRTAATRIWRLSFGGVYPEPFGFAQGRLRGRAQDGL